MAKHGFFRGLKTFLTFILILVIAAASILGFCCAVSDDFRDMFVAKTQIDKILEIDNKKTADALGEAQSNLAEAVKQNSDLLLQLSENQNGLSVRVSKCEELQEDISALQASKAQLEAQLTAQQNLAASLKTQLDQITEQLQNASGDIESLVAQQQELTNQLTACETEIEEIKTSLNNINEAIEENNSKLTALQTEITEAKATISTIQSKITQLENTINSLQTQITELSKKLDIIVDPELAYANLSFGDVTFNGKGPHTISFWNGAANKITTHGRRLLVHLEMWSYINNGVYWISLQIDDGDPIDIGVATNTQLYSISKLVTIDDITAGEHTFNLIFTCQNDNSTLVMPKWNDCALVLCEI